MTPSSAQLPGPVPRPDHRVRSFSADPPAIEDAAPRHERDSCNDQLVSGSANLPSRGLEALSEGLPHWPVAVDRSANSILAIWKGPVTAAVLFLRYWEGDSGDLLPGVTMATYQRDGRSWRSNHRWHGVGWSHDPIGDPDSIADLGGRPIVSGGGNYGPEARAGRAAFVATGRVSPEVAEVGLIQKGRTQRAAPGHFGAWIICISPTLRDRGL